MNDSNDTTKLGIYLKGLLIFILTIGTNFIGHLFNKEQQNLFKYNKYIKYLTAGLVFNLTIHYMNNGGNPIDHMILTIITLIIFLMFKKLNTFYSLLLLTILILIVFLLQFIDYYKKTMEDKNIVNRLESYVDNLSILFIIIFIIGFIKCFKYSNKNIINNIFD